MTPQQPWGRAFLLASILLGLLIAQYRGHGVGSTLAPGTFLLYLANYTIGSAVLVMFIAATMRALPAWLVQKEAFAGEDYALTISLATVAVACAFGLLIVLAFGGREVTSSLCDCGDYYQEGEDWP